MKIYNLKKTFENFTLSIDDLHIPQGKIYGIIGPNGCGKSTLVKIIANTIKKDSGKIDYEGLTSKDITMVPRKSYMIHDTVYNNLVYPLEIRNIKPRREIVDEYLKLADFNNEANKYAPGLSGGQMQKLALIRAMIFSPKFTIIDEGFSNLDIESTFTFEKEILKRQKENPATWIIISHQISSVSRLCDYIYFMWDGKVIAEGDRENMIYNPKIPELKRYLQTVSLS
ncbi:ATP-binding cassette domain-containing protein [Miniphocaeibacter halophilus]|uniref:ABC transporter ATP-binding protein n=1 Tax=Miniphocaeibacter halophilus TaxID=2931922 RepID=A0AC61N3F4_9FIRM|nr:ABC transporter ATP-binding protein [Miniphocaeibacter halophilus]QQK09048.1 ABC transporter ATP-binding protein [Miniphocaeibacter halophilus]